MRATRAGLMPCLSIASASRRRCSNCAELPFGLIASSGSKHQRISRGGICSYITFSKSSKSAKRQVPRKRQVPAPGNITASVIEAIRFEDDESELRRYYIKLLASCIDKDCSNSYIRRFRLSF